MHEDDKFLYEKAIEERMHHQQNFNHWMNMYAIFNGALFVGLYSTLCKGEDYVLYRMIIGTLGIIAGWSWFFSVTGYYDWIQSWITIVSYYESKLKLYDGSAVFLYRLYGGTSKKPFSTQKLTKSFTFCVAVGWLGVMAWNILSLWNINIFLARCIISVVLVLIILGYFIYVGLRSQNDLKDTHKRIEGNLETPYTIVSI